MAKIIESSIAETAYAPKLRDIPSKPHFPPFHSSRSVRPRKSKPYSFIREAEVLKSWCINHALPFWANNARDEQGGFYEDLHLDGIANTEAIRRVRVQARQIFVYAGASRLGWYKPGHTIAEQTYQFMTKHGLSPDNSAGFVHLINPDYSVNNSQRDLYDHAFYLLGCSSLLGLTESPLHTEVKILTATLVNFINDALKSSNGGWLEGLPVSLPRRQNPHMHLLETSMALFDATDDRRYLEIAHKVYALFETHFFDSKHNVVREFFKDDWTVADGDDGMVAEPGHAAEWVCLLWQYQRRTSIDTSTYAKALYENAFKSGAIFLNDEETVTGEPVRETKRLWVQTEVIRAHLAQMERGDVSAQTAAARTMKAFRDVYLNDDGTWVDQIDASGKPCAKTIPTSSFYHIFGMITEAARLANIT